MSLLNKQASPAAIAVNNAGNGHGEMAGDDPLLENLESNTKYGGENEAGNILKYLRSLGWKRPGRAGTSVTDRQSPNGQDEIWVDYDGWRHVSRVTGQWEVLGEGKSLSQLKAHLAGRKLAMRPDYGSGYTAMMNNANEAEEEFSKEAERTILPESTTPQSNAYGYDPRMSETMKPIAENPREEENIKPTKISPYIHGNPNPSSRQAPKSAPAWVTGSDKTAYEATDDDLPSNFFPEGAQPEKEKREETAKADSLLRRKKHDEAFMQDLRERGFGSKGMKHYPHQEPSDDDMDMKTAERTIMPEQPRPAGPSAYSYDPNMSETVKPIAENPHEEENIRPTKISPYIHENPNPSQREAPKSAPAWVTGSKESKGVSAGCNIVVETPIKTASDAEMYVSSVEFSPKNATLVEKFSFTADPMRAMVFHRLTANEVASQISSPAFGARAHVIAAVKYEDMFKALLGILPALREPIQREIAWAKKVLEKQDRITWYLRWYRLALATDVLNSGDRWGTMAPSATTASKTADTLPLQPQQQAPHIPPPQKQKPALGPKEQLEKLIEQYKKEFAAKSGGRPPAMISLSDFPAMKRALEHFLSLPVPEIQNKVFTVESYSDIYNAFSVAEQEWKEQAKALLKPKTEDKVWMQFPNGWAWFWLPRAYCSEEQRAMGHCGNSPMEGAANVSILSLREPKQAGAETLWYPHLTFILHGPGDRGSLGEMKGRGNDKPVAKYHPYIIALLKDPRIYGIVGGGYKPENNFALSDLTPEQRQEVAAANPAVGLSISDYNKKYGLDEKLATKIVVLIDLPPGTQYVPQYGFVLRQWANRDDLIKDKGNGEAEMALEFIETGKTNKISPPDGGEMADLLDDADEQIVNNVGLALQYAYAPEINEWEQDFDPRDKKSVQRLIKDVYDLKVAPPVQPSGKLQLRKKDEYAEKAPRQEPNYRMPVINELYMAYMNGGPDRDDIEDMLREAVDEALSDMRDSVPEYDGKGGILQVLEPETAIQLAIAAESGTPHPSYTMRNEPFEPPRIEMPYQWDNWSAENAVGVLDHFFGQPPKRPETEKQQNLPYKGKGIKVTKLLKNPLFKSANAQLRR